jgi:two-component system, cell cycle sensor histidine kinase and response regulator CckA
MSTLTSLPEANGREAVQIWQEHAARIDLLFTDRVMPEGMSGMELHKMLHEQKPGLKTLISIGYSTELVYAGAPIAAGIAYLPKPYDMVVLARTVRDCLDRKE